MYIRLFLLIGILIFSQSCATNPNKKDSQIVLLIDQFFDQEKGNKDYETYVTSVRSLCEDITKILSDENPSKFVSDKLTLIDDMQFSKYRDFLFSKHGFIINTCYPGYHILLLQIEEKDQWLFKDNRLTVRYQVIADRDSPCHKNLTNMSMILLNKERFEVFRFFVGNLKEGCSATGKFEISEKQYNEIRSVTNVTDQDEWDPGLFHFGISARRHR